jgi:hypothetical protein
VRTNPHPHPTLRERVVSIREASQLALRALLHHRMGFVLPLMVALLLISYAGMVLGLLSPLVLFPRGAQVVPFIYPLF